MPMSSRNHNDLHLCSSLAVESGTFLTTSVKRTVTLQPSSGFKTEGQTVQLYFAEAPMPHCMHVPQYQPAKTSQKVNKRATSQHYEEHEEAKISNISNMLFMYQLSKACFKRFKQCTLCAVSSALSHFQVPWSLLERCRLQCH